MKWNLPGATGMGTTGTPGRPWRTRSPMTSAGATFTCAGNRWRTFSAGPSARAASTNTAEPKSDLSGTIARLIPNLPLLQRNRDRVLRHHLAHGFPQRGDHGLEGLLEAVVPVSRKPRCPFRRCSKGRKFSGRRDAELIEVLWVHQPGVGEMRQHRLVAIDGLEHQEIRELGCRGPAAGGHPVCRALPRADGTGPSSSAVIVANRLAARICSTVGMKLSSRTTC